MEQIKNKKGILTITDNYSKKKEIKNKLIEFLKNTNFKIEGEDRYDFYEYKISNKEESEYIAKVRFSCDYLDCSVTPEDKIRATKLFQDFADKTGIDVNIKIKGEI